MAGFPRYVGSKTGEVVRAIAVDSKHSWRDLQTYTGLSEKDLNYHLSILYNDNVLIRQGKEYYIVPELEEQYLTYYQQPTTTKTPTNKASKTNLPETTSKVSSFSFHKSRGIALLAILLISLFFNLSYTNQINQLTTQNNTQTEQIQELTSTIQQHEDTIKQLTANINELNNQLEAILQGNQEPATPESPPNDSETDKNPELDDSNSNTPDDSPPSTVQRITIERISYCTRVIDGDTIDLSNDIRIRLADIDAPESIESGYSTSTNALESWVLGKRIYIDYGGATDYDQYNRLVCVIYVSTSSGYVNVNQALLEDGYAVIDDYSNNFSPSDWTRTESLDTGGAQIDAPPSTEPDDSDEETTPEPETPSTPSYTGPYWASKNSNIYHKPSCYWAKKISSSNLIVFSSKSAAEAEGYRACQVCKP